MGIWHLCSNTKPLDLLFSPICQVRDQFIDLPETLWQAVACLSSYCELEQKIDLNFISECCSVQTRVCLAELSSKSRKSQRCLPASHLSVRYWIWNTRSLWLKFDMKAEWSFRIESLYKTKTPNTHPVQASDTIWLCTSFAFNSRPTHFSSLCQIKMSTFL